jgi:hypothetical protein
MVISLTGYLGLSLRRGLGLDDLLCSCAVVSCLLRCLHSRRALSANGLLCGSYVLCEGLQGAGHV